MTVRVVVRSTRGLIPGDTVARLLPDGQQDATVFKIQEIVSGVLLYWGVPEQVFYLDGIISPFGKALVKMAVTESVPWCVTRNDHT